MPEFLVWLLLSLGSGAAYALLGNGIVAIYKGSGVLNFSQGAIAMFATFCYLALTKDQGLNHWVALAVVMAGAAICGALVAVLILRPLRNAPTLAKVLVTLGLLTGLQGLAAIIWGNQALLVPSLLPTDGISVGDNFVGEDRLYMAGIALAITAVLWAVYRFTRLGLATQAVSQSERGASLLGFSPTTISAINWGLGSALAALAGVFIAPITTLDVATLPLVVVPALAAALVGRFSSFWITTLAAFGIAWAETATFSLWTLQGVQSAVPFVIVIAVMVVAGRALPSRGALSEGRPARAPLGFRVRLTPTLLFSGAAVILFAVLSTTYSTALAYSLTAAIIALSLVVLTGFVGQISLMQMTFAGIGGLFTAKFASNWGIPFPLPIVMAAIVAAPIGAVLGSPALRVRGLSLAIVTLGAAVAIDAVIFQNGTISHGNEGLEVPSPHLWGFSLDPFEHTMRFGVFTLIALVLVALLVGNVRRSGIGRRMLAVRSNERAAAASGVNVPMVKLQAFALSSAIAALGGGVLAYANPFLLLGEGAFGATPSINLLIMAYIGGIALVSGGVLGGLVISGGVLYALLSGISGFSDWYPLLSGVALILTLIMQPDGATEYVGRHLRRLLGMARARRAPGSGGPPGSDGSRPPSERPAPAPATAAVRAPLRGS
jgi:branched-subunit amino acid ABC-type transport system permease component